MASVLFAGVFWVLAASTVCSMTNGNPMVQSKTWSNFLYKIMTVWVASGRLCFHRPYFVYCKPLNRAGEEGVVCGVVREDGESRFEGGEGGEDKRLKA